MAYQIYETNSNGIKKHHFGPVQGNPPADELIAEIKVMLDEWYDREDFVYVGSHGNSKMMIFETEEIPEDDTDNQEHYILAEEDNDDEDQEQQDDDDQEHDTAALEAYPYKQESYRRFCLAMDCNGVPWQDYKGRNFYHGPAVTTSDVKKKFDLEDDNEAKQYIIRCTRQSLQWDNFGLGWILYPR